MIRSQTVWSRTVPGTSSRSKPTTTGGAAQEPPTTALPPGSQKTCESHQRLLRGETGPGDNPIDRGIPVRDISMYHLDIGQIQHPGHPSHQIDPPARSIEKTKRVSGITTLSGIPGRPTPEPTSRTRSGVSRNPPAKSNESPICRLSTRTASLGPIPPASTASVSSHSRYRSRVETRVGDSSRPAHSLHRAQRRWEGST